MITELLLSILEQRVASHGEAIVMKVLDALVKDPPTPHILDATADALEGSSVAQKIESQNSTPRCPRCQGSGSVRIDCTKCQGSGRV